MTLMRTLILVALFANNALGDPLPVPPEHFAQAKPIPDEEEEDPAPGASTPAPGANAEAAKPAAPPKAIAPRTDSPTAEAAADQQKLVSGAPLYNPNVAVHIVEKKEFSDAKRLELRLVP